MSKNDFSYAAVYARELKDGCTKREAKKRARDLTYRIFLALLHHRPKGAWIATEELARRVDASPTRVERAGKPILGEPHLMATASGTIH